MAFVKEYGGEPFKFMDHEVVATFEVLPGEVEQAVESKVRAGEAEYWQARQVALQVALKKLVVDGTIIYRNQLAGGQRIKGGAGQRLPSPREYYDRDAQETLTRRLLAMVVKEEFWLGDMYPECFGEFVEEEEEEEIPRANPTAAPKGTKKEE